MSDKIVKGFAFLGLISVVAISLYYIVKGLQKLQYDRTYAEENIPTWPPYEYMQNIGSVCPTGWEIGQLSDGKISCTNSDYGLQSSFTPIDNWGECIKNYRNDNSTCTALKERCDYLKNNTYNDSDNTRIPWVGVSNLCN